MFMLQRAIHVCHDLTSKTREPNQQKPGGHVYSTSAQLLLHRTTQCLFLPRRHTTHMYGEECLLSLTCASATYIRELYIQLYPTDPFHEFLETIMKPAQRETFPIYRGPWVPTWDHIRYDYGTVSRLGGYAMN